MTSGQSDHFIADMLPAGVVPEDVYALLAGFAAFLTVVAVGNTMIKRDKFAPRIKQLKQRREQLRQDFLQKENVSAAHRSSERVGFMRRILEIFHFTGGKELATFSDILVSAGWRSKDAMIVFLFFQFVVPIAFFALSLAALPFFETSTPLIKITLVIGALYTGLKLPLMVVKHVRDKRWYMIRKGIPDALDLMMICAEAGLTLSAALDRISKELKYAYPELADELTLTSIEIGFLPERRKALDNLVRRVDIPEIRGLTGVLIQTEKYGTPIAQALRVLTKEFRMQRTLRAEQKAARLPVIMTVPMMTFILPTLFIVIMTPAVLQIIDEMRF